MSYQQLTKKEVPELYLVTVTTPENKVYKQYVVLGTTLFDPSGTATRYKELVGNDFNGCELARKKIEQINQQETKEGDPMYPANYKVMAETMEFEIAGIEEV